MSSVVTAVIGLRVLYQSAQPIGEWKHWGLILAMGLAELFAFTVLSPVFGFTAPTLETGLVLAVLMICSFQVMRTVLKVFESTGELIRKARERRWQRGMYLPPK